MKTLLVWTAIIVLSPLLLIWLPFLMVMKPERWECSGARARRPRRH